MPMCLAIKRANPNIKYIEVVSTISSASAGPGTRKNISQYITATENAIRDMLDIPSVKVIINITPAIPPIHMKTSILIDSDAIISESKTKLSIQRILSQVKAYAPGYFVSVDLTRLGPKTFCQVQVTGSGHYLPAYAGNLDIINCAAIEVIKKL